MPLDAAGEVIGGAIEVVGDVLADFGIDAAAEALEARRRRRRGCWRLLLIVLVVALIVWGVVMLSG